MNINLLLSPQTDANWLVRCPFLYPLVSVILEKASQAGLRPVARKKFVRPAEWSAVLNWASKDLRQTVSAFYQRVVFELCDKQCRYASLTTTIQRTVRSICKSYILIEILLHPILLSVFILFMMNDTSQTLTYFR